MNERMTIHGKTFRTVDIISAYNLVTNVIIPNDSKDATIISYINKLSMSQLDIFVDLLKNSELS